MTWHQVPSDRRAQDQGHGEHTREEDGAGGDHAQGKAPRVLGCDAALAGKAQGHGCRRYESTQHPGDAVAPVGADRSSRQIAEKVDCREDEDDGPELARPDRVARTEGSRGKQRQDDHGEDSKVQRRAELGLADAGDELADPTLLGQGQDRDGSHAGGERLVSQAGKTASGEHQERGRFGRAVAISRLHRGDHVGGDRQGGGATHQDRGQEQAVIRGEPAGDPAQQTQEEECPHAGKPRAGA